MFVFGKVRQNPLDRDDFQEVLWQRLSDSDVLVMLDTENYFDSRWTKLEFGHALAKSLVPLRLGWPGVKQSPRSQAAESVQFSAADFEADGKRLKAETLETAGLAIEKARSRGIASNALASSIVLVCRRRPPDALVISRREFLRELNVVLPEALDEMTKGSGDDRSPVAPVDLSQAIIGPGDSTWVTASHVLSEVRRTPRIARTPTSRQVHARAA